MFDFKSSLTSSIAKPRLHSSGHFRRMIWQFVFNSNSQLNIPLANLAIRKCYHDITEIRSPFQVKKKQGIKDKKAKEMSDDMRAMEEAALKAFKQDLIKNPALAAQYGVRLPDAKKGSSFSVIFALIMLFMFRTPFVVRSVAHYHHFVWIRSLVLLQMLT